MGGLECQVKAYTLYSYVAVSRGVNVYNQRAVRCSACTQKSETKSARKARERRARDEEREARSAAEAVKSRSRMLKALVEVSRLRQRVEEGDATQREITDAINKSTREAVECTRRVIRMCTEV